MQSRMQTLIFEGTPEPWPNSPATNLSVHAFTQLSWTFSQRASRRRQLCPLSAGSPATGYGGIGIGTGVIGPEGLPSTESGPLCESPGIINSPPRANPPAISVSPMLPPHEWKRQCRQDEPAWVAVLKWIPCDIPKPIPSAVEPDWVGLHVSCRCTTCGAGKQYGNGTRPQPTSNHFPSLFVMTCELC